ncbi:MAG: DegV family protein, partial [Lachnospiraceae bacterium]|nr:DegV family protein [Lachnospiraceae bacterium]
LCHWFTVDDLVYLKRGGRIDPKAAFVASVLNIKPVLHMDDEGHFVNVIDSFNSEEGAIAARAAVDLMNSAAFVAGDSVEDLRNIAGAVVADSFSYFRASDILGENLGVAKMPSFTAGGTSYPMSFYDSAWLMGVRSGETPERQTILHDLSRFLSGEAAQEILFDELEWLPTNLNCRSLAKVLETEWMLPLIEGADQAVPQGAIFGGWWGVASEFAADLANADTDAKILEALRVYEDKLYGLIFELTDPSVREAYTAIGFLDGTYFDVDFRMKETDGIWETEKAFDMAAGTEFRVRKGMSWEEAYPENNANYVVGTSGLYYIRFDPATGTITLRDASQEEIDVTL